MKRNINFLLSMVYPMLISLFICCFAQAFVDIAYNFYVPFAGALTFIFFILFLIGIILNIRYSLKHKDEN